MANNYLEFSEVLPNLTIEEQHWLEQQLEIVYVFDGKVYLEGKLPKGRTESDAEFVGCRGYRDMPNYDSDFNEDAGFCYEFSADDSDQDWGRYLSIYAEENGFVDRVVHLVQKFLKQFHSDQCWSLTYATTCSKPRVGEFGGGAVFVTATEIKWQDAHAFVEEQRAAFTAR